MPSKSIRSVAIEVEPGALARVQVKRDRQRVGGQPHLLAHKIERMSASPLAFLRGSAPLYYDVLKANPRLLPALPGKGWLAGDLHLENFGAFRPDGFAADGSTARVVYGPNDFDDAIVGPWAYDVLRLTTSLLLSARSWSVGPRALGLAELLVNSHAAGIAGGSLPPLPRPVSQLLERVRERKRVELLERFTDKAKGRRTLCRGEHFYNLAKSVAVQAKKAFANYVAGLSEEDRPPAEALEILDMAFRVAGTGSLGVLRIAFLVAGKGGPDGAWLFDMKEQGVPSPACLLRVPDMPPAERVLTAERACLEHPPRLAGTTRLGSRLMFVRRLAPQEDRVDLTDASHADIEAFVRYLGSLAGRAHARGAVQRAGPWTPLQREQLLDAAMAMAGLHEATYLAFLRESR